MSFNSQSAEISPVWKEIFSWLESVGVSPNNFSVNLALDSEAYISLLLKKNEVVNLTAIRDLDTGRWKHLADSLVLLRLEPLGTLVDWGSGGGMPGIPLALARKSQKNPAPVLFIDSVGKKISAVQGFCESLGLHNVGFLHKRGEEWLRTVDTPPETIVMRAVAPSEEAVKWISPRVKRWVFMIGPNQRDGWLSLEKKWGKLGFALAEDFSYSLPAGMGDRCLFVLQKK